MKGAKTRIRPFHYWVRWLDDHHRRESHSASHRPSLLWRIALLVNLRGGSGCQNARSFPFAARRAIVKQREPVQSPPFSMPVSAHVRILCVILTLLASPAGSCVFGLFCNSGPACCKSHCGMPKRGDSKSRPTCPESPATVSALTVISESTVSRPSDTTESPAFVSSATLWQAANVLHDRFFIDLGHEHSPPDKHALYSSFRI